MSEVHATRCNHQLEGKQQLMLVCLSKKCNSSSRACCSHCVVEQHLHDNMLEFQRRQEVSERLSPYIKLTEQRTELQAEIEQAYEGCLTDILELLEKDKRALIEQLEKAMPGKLASQIVKISEQNYEDVQMMSKLTNPKKQLMSEEELKDTVVKYRQLSAKVMKWRQTMAERIKQKDPRGEAYAVKRDRQHNVSEDATQKSKKPSQPQPVQPSGLSFVPYQNFQLKEAPQEKPSISPQRSVSTQQTSKETPKPMQVTFASPNPYPVHRVEDFEKGIALINQNLTSSVFRIHVHEPQKYLSVEYRINNGRNMIGFFNELSKLVNVTTLQIEIGEHNVLFTNHLEKLEQKLCTLPLLKEFAFSCVVDMPTNWCFPLLRDKVPYNTGGKWDIKLTPRSKKQLI